MERRTLVADFAHVAHHEDARRRLRREHVDGGAHRIGVRVVRIVDDGCAFDRRQRGALHLQAALYRSNASRPLLIASSDTPAASAAAVAASALRALCSPSTRNPTESGPCGVTISTLVPAMRPVTAAFEEIVGQREIDDRIAGRGDAPDARVGIVGGKHGRVSRRRCLREHLARRRHRQPHRRFRAESDERTTEAAVKGTVDGKRLSIDTPEGQSKSRCKCSANTTRTTRWPRRRRARRGRFARCDQARPRSVRPVKGRLQVKRAALGRSRRNRDRRHLQRESRFDARRDRRARGSPSPRVLVMGDMGEVGDNGPAFHREIGAYARGTRHRRAVRDGRCRATPARRIGGSNAAALDRYRRARSRNCSRPASDPAATFLVKGSRFMQMERVVDAVTSPQPTRIGHYARRTLK